MEGERKQILLTIQRELIPVENELNKNEMKVMDFFIRNILNDD